LWMRMRQDTRKRDGQQNGKRVGNHGNKNQCRQRRGAWPAERFYMCHFVFFSRCSIGGSVTKPTVGTPERLISSITCMITWYCRDLSPRRKTAFLFLAPTMRRRS